LRNTAQAFCSGLLAVCRKARARFVVLIMVRNTINLRACR
jgi:hypothetical protein